MSFLQHLFTFNEKTIHKHSCFKVPYNVYVYFVLSIQYIQTGCSFHILWRGISVDIGGLYVIYCRFMSTRRHEVSVQPSSKIVVSLLLIHLHAFILKPLVTTFVTIELTLAHWLPHSSPSKPLHSPFVPIKLYTICSVSGQKMCVKKSDSLDGQL